MGAPSSSEHARDVPFENEAWLWSFWGSPRWWFFRNRRDHRDLRTFRRARDEEPELKGPTRPDHIPRHPYTNTFPQGLTSMITTRIVGGAAVVAAAFSCGYLLQAREDV